MKDKKARHVNHAAAGLAIRDCAGRYARAVHHVTLLLPDFSLIALGWLLCRHTALGRGVWQAVEQLVYFFLFPVYLFQSIVRAPLDSASNRPLRSDHMKAKSPTMDKMKVASSKAVGFMGFLD